MIALVAHFRRDRALALATLLAAIFVLWPLAETAIVPLMDLPHHAALAAVLGDLLLGRAPATTFYELNFTTPYWTFYVLLAIATRLFGVFAGTKIVVGLSLLVVPLGAMRLLVALRRSPWPALTAFLLSWDYSVYFGWVSFVLGIGLAFFALARILEARSIRDALRCWPLVALVAATHGLAIAFLGAMGALAALSTLRTARIGRTALALAPPAVLIVPWLAGAATAAAAPPLHLTYDPFETKLRHLFADTVGAGLVGQRIEAAQIGAFVTLATVPLVLLVMRRRAAAPLGPAIAPVIAAAAAYFFLPLAVTGPVEHWGDYPRFASPLFVGLLFVPRPRIVGWTRLFLAAPLLGAIGSLGYQTGNAFATLDGDLSALQEICERIRPGASVLPLAFENRMTPAAHPIGEAIENYAAAVSRGYDPYLFGYPTNLVHYRSGQRPPAPARWGRVPSAYRSRAFASAYDYILVQGLAYDPVWPGPIPGGKRVTKIAEKRRWRLYEVR